MVYNSDIKDKKKFDIMFEIIIRQILDLFYDSYDFEKMFIKYIKYKNIKLENCYDIEDGMNEFFRIYK